MTPLPRLLRSFGLAAALGMASASACAEEAELCWPEGDWDELSWCQFPADDIEARDGLEGYPLVVTLPEQRDGCGSCDAEVLDLVVQEAAFDRCPDGDFELEPGCFALQSETADGIPVCEYLAFVWGESCTAEASP